VGLGWQARDAEQAIAAVEADLAEEAAANGSADNGSANGGPAGDAAPETDVAAMLRAALRKLSRA
jgi:hypothetical protein